MRSPGSSKHAFGFEACAVHRGRLTLQGRIRVPLTFGPISGSILFIAACASVVLVGIASAWNDQHFRSRRYRRAKQRHSIVETEAALPESAPLATALEKAQAPDWFHGCQNDINVEHERAVRLQKMYHSCVAQCIAVLSIGVIVTCLHAIALRSNEDLEKFATHYDLIATLYALIFFILARVANRKFVKQRSFVEFLRAWMHLAIIFPLERFRGVDDAYRIEKDAIWSRFSASTRVALSFPDGSAEPSSS
jgi:hypothetical protein